MCAIRAEEYSTYRKVHSRLTAGRIWWRAGKPPDLPGEYVYLDSAPFVNVFARAAVGSSEHASQSHNSVRSAYIQGVKPKGARHAVVV